MSVNLRHGTVQKSHRVLTNVRAEVRVAHRHLERLVTDI
jgi:hypothetical protein